MKNATVTFDRLEQRWRVTLYGDDYLTVYRGLIGSATTTREQAYDLARSMLLRRGIKASIRTTSGKDAW